jgi:hypothetical protein
MISPGFIETTGAHGMIADIVCNTGASEAAARQQIVDMLGGIPVGRARPAGGGRRVGRIPGVRPRRLRQWRQLCAGRRDHPNRLIASPPPEGR